MDDVHGVQVRLRHRMRKADEKVLSSAGFTPVLQHSPVICVCVLLFYIYFFSIIVLIKAFQCLLCVSSSVVALYNTLCIIN